MQKAKELKVGMAIAVLDRSGVPIAFQKMDGVPAFIPEVAFNKAYTSAAIFVDSENLSGAVQPGKPLYGLPALGGGKIVTFGGGKVLKIGGKIVGAIGCSGGSVEQDIACAQAAVDFLAGKK